MMTKIMKTYLSFNRTSEVNVSGTNEFTSDVNTLDGTK